MKHTDEPLDPSKPDALTNSTKVDLARAMSGSLTQICESIAADPDLTSALNLMVEAIQHNANVQPVLGALPQEAITMLHKYLTPLTEALLNAPNQLSHCEVVSNAMAVQRMALRHLQRSC